MFYKQSTKAMFVQLPKTNTMFVQISTGKGPISSTGIGGSIRSGNSGGSASGASGTSNVITSAFTKQGIKLLKIYANNCIEDYFTEVETNFKKLKKTYPQYKFDDSAYVISSFIDAVYNLLTVNDTLDDEIKLLRQKIASINADRQKIIVKEGETVTQSSSIKLVYLQYMLLYDLTLTNGKFVQIYLDEAEKVLRQNGGILYHPSESERNNNRRDILRKRVLYTKQETKVVQNTSIKLVYMQYLLLFDLTHTDGVFIDKFLKEAESILERNGGELFHPHKAYECDSDED